MAGHYAYRTKFVRLAVLFVLACLTVGLVRRFQLLYLVHRERVQANLNPTARRDRIHGRWEAVRTSLDLAPLPHAALIPSHPVSLSRSDKQASRLDLGSKRQAEEASRRLPPLHFAPDTHLAQPDEAAPTHPDGEKGTRTQ